MARVSTNEVNYAHGLSKQTPTPSSSSFPCVFTTKFHLLRRSSGNGCIRKQRPNSAKSRRFVLEMIARVEEKTAGRKRSGVDLRFRSILRETLCTGQFPPLVLGKIFRASSNESGNRQRVTKPHVEFSALEKIWIRRNRHTDSQGEVMSVGSTNLLCLRHMIPRTEKRDVFAFMGIISLVSLVR